MRALELLETSFPLRDIDFAKIDHHGGPKAAGNGGGRVL